MLPRQLRLEVRRPVARIATLCVLMLALCAQASAQASDNKSQKLMFVAVSVNQQAAIDPISVAHSSHGGYLISEGGLKTLRLRVPSSGGQRIGDETFYPVEAIDGASASFDDATQTLNVNVSGSAFNSGNYNEHYVAKQQIDASANGGFLNYDIFYQNTQPATLSGLVEAGAFFHDGTLTSRFVMSDVNGHHDLYRLDTQYTRDEPDDAATLVIGDSISDASSWSRSVYFGGIQWHSNFGIRPDLQALPLPSISGTAAVPSTVDLYVDNVLRQRQLVDAGPFTLANVPAFSGQGNLMVVVRDPLGREQLYTQSYLSSPSLLKQGVSEDGFDAGALRENYGQEGANYGPEFGSAQWRYGLTEASTMELHAEQSQGLAAAGAGLSQGLGTFGVATLGAAGSHDGPNNGLLVYGQFDHQTPFYGVSLRSQWSSPSFRELGFAQDDAIPKTQTQAQANVALGDGVSVLAGYTRQNNRTQASIQTLNYGLTWSAGRYGTVFAGLLQSFAPDHATSANVVWTVPLGAQRFAQVNVSRQSGQTQSSLEYDDTPPAELGWGTRLRRSLGQFAGDDIGATLRTQTGEYSLSASNTGGADSVQAEVRGGFAIIDGHLIPTKWLDQSFALVKVPSNAPIDIYANGVKVGHTDENGIGFVPNLVAYEPNHVVLDGENLPLQMSVDLAARDVVPRTRSGVVVAFGVKREEGASATLTYADGRPIENGARVLIDKPEEEETRAPGRTARPSPSASDAASARDEDQITVALRGRVFIPNISLPAEISVHTREGLCHFTLPAASINDAVMPDLGVVRCAQAT